MDMVDALEAAEDGWATAAHTAAETLKLLDATQLHGPAIAEIRAGLVAIATSRDGHCRPNCGAEGDPDSDECDDDTCGCPCNHTGIHDE